MIFIIFCILAGLFIHLNIIIQVSQHSSIFFLNLSTAMLTSAFKDRISLWQAYNSELHKQSGTLT